MRTRNISPSRPVRQLQGDTSRRAGGNVKVEFDDGTTVVAQRIRFVGFTGGEDEEGDAIITVGEDGTIEITSITTDETDTALVLHPDGEGGVEWGPDATGGGKAIYTNDNSGSALTLNLSSATVFDITLTDDCTLTFSSPPADDLEHEWIFIFRQPTTGGPFTVTWPASVQWQDSDGTSGGSAPTLYTAAGAEDVFTITTLDNGVTYGGGQERRGGAGAETLDDLTDVTITSPAENDTLRYVGGLWINDVRKYEVVTNGEDILVWEDDELVHEFTEA